MAKRAGKKKSPKSKPWFIKVRGSYLPNSWEGWLTYIPYTAYLLITLNVSFEDNTTWLNRGLSVLVYWVVGVAVMTWIAARKS